MGEAALSDRADNLVENFEERVAAGEIPIVVGGSDERWHIGTWHPSDPQACPLLCEDARGDQDPCVFVVAIARQYHDEVEADIARERGA